MYYDRFLKRYVCSKYLSRFSIFCTSKGRYVQQDWKDGPVYYCDYEDRTVFRNYDEVEIVASIFEDKFGEKFEVRYEGTDPGY